MQDPEMKPRKQRRKWDNSICRQEDCKEPAKKMGLCLKHYNAQQWLRRTGQTELKPRIRRSFTNDICAKEGCGRKATLAYRRGGDGYCKTHYGSRWFEERFENEPGYKEKLTKEVAKRNRLRFTGFSHELFEQRLQAQDGKCPICGVTLVSSGRLNESATADHCHYGHLPRGVICRGCNVSIGVYENHQRKIPCFKIEPYESYLDRWECFRAGCQHPELPPLRQSRRGREPPAPG